MDQGRGGGKADGQPLLAGREAETQSDVGLAGAAGAKSDDVLAALDVVATGEVQDQSLVEAGDGREIEAVEALDGGKAGGLDAPPLFMTLGMRPSRSMSSSSARRSR